MARISLLCCLVAVIAFGHIVNEASARRLKLSEHRHGLKVRKPPWTPLDREIEDGEKKNILKTLELIKTGKVLLKELKAEEPNVDGWKQKSKFLSKSEADLKIMLRRLESGEVKEKKGDSFLKKLKAIYKTWRKKTSKAHVPEKEKEIISGQVKEKKGDSFLKELKAIYKTWRKRTSKAHVPEKEKEIMSGQVKEKKGDSFLKKLKAVYKAWKKRTSKKARVLEKEREIILKIGELVHTLEVQKKEALKAKLKVKGLEVHKR